jgi:thermitase
VSDEHRPRQRSFGAGDDSKTASNCEWSLEKARVIEAWTLFNGALPGAGVTVGHPDTGCTPHPELADPARLLVSQGFDFDDDDPDPTDDLDSQFMDNPGHGTSTGSVIASSRGGDPNPSAVEFVSGVAPFASLIPIRTTESVLLFSMRSLRQAIDHAVGKGCQVISMSLGGPTPSLALRAAVRRAVEAGTIVLAAAGNYVRIVVFPAAFDDAIAVAASNVLDKPWSQSCQGDAVDITAPGEMVWHAKVEREGAAGFRFSVERSSGTSYAVATAAGVAALWISLHGWTALSRRYGVENIPRVFKALLQKTCRTPKGWNTSSFGPGIVDAHALLSAPLPDAVPARKLRDPRRAAVATDTTGLEAILHLVPDAPRANVEQAVAEMLGVSDRDLPRVLQEVGDEFAFQLVMQPALRDELERRASGVQVAKGARGKGRGTRRAAAPVANKGLMSSRLSRKMQAAG